MKIERTIYHHVTDPPMVLKSDEVLENTHFIGTGSRYGRYLFAEQPVFVEADGDNITIRNNQFNGTWEVDPFTRWQSLRWRWVMFKRDVRFLRSLGPEINWLLLRLKLRWMFGR